MSRLNRELILSNLAEAREELERIEALVGVEGGRLSEGELSVMFGHAYHHINFAWNARRAPMKKYRNMKDEDFDAWGRFPADLELPTLAESD